jgi:site-specific DNA recombinase
MGDSQTAAIYVRLSQKGKRSLEEQEQAGREACDTNGWPVAEVYSDTVSASRFAREDRPDWARLLADLEAGRFGVLVLWESSRGDRDPETWMALLRRCREHKILIHVVSEDHTYDPAKARDWKSLAESGIDSAYESEKTSLRVQRSMAGAAHRGRPHGPTVYGYERVYDSRTGHLKEQRANPVTAPVVAEIVRRLAAGEPVSTVTADLNNRKIPSPRGGIWQRGQVRKVGLNPAYIAKRLYAGELFDAQWPPLVPTSQHYSVVRRMGEPDRKASRPGSQKYLLSYLARCGVCGAYLKGVPRSGRRGRDMYGCSAAGHVYAGMREMDDHVARFAREEMYSPQFREALGTLMATDELAVRARDTAAELRARLDELARMAAAGEISPRGYQVAEAELLPKIAEADKRAAAHPIPGIPEPTDIYATWEEMLIPQRRELVAWLAKSIVLLKPPKPARQPFDGTRVEIEWATRPGARYRYQYTPRD